MEIPTERNSPWYANDDNAYSVDSNGIIKGYNNGIVGINSYGIQ